MIHEDKIPLTAKRNVIVKDNGLRLTPSGQTLKPKEAMTKLTKGERRKVRQALHRMGRGGMAKASL